MMKSLKILRNCLKIPKTFKSTLKEEKISSLIREHFDLRPKQLIEMLDLKRPIYQSTAAYGHFGREEDAFTWEKTDKAEALKAHQF